MAIVAADGELQKLQKILALEARQGYRDEAVAGGLANFVHLWRVA